MGYGGKFVARERARELRAQSWTLQEIADELGVAKGSVSVWVRDVDFTPKPRNGAVFVHENTSTCDGNDRGGNLFVRNPG